jgi:predicted flap endonuclease-1-like 5' DNA nuclease
MTATILPEHEDTIRARAYAIYLEEGRPNGRHDIHWQRAVAEFHAAAAAAPVVVTRVVASVAAPHVAMPTVTRIAKPVAAVEDVSLISGIGPKIEKQLEAEGITKLSQIAKLSAAALATLDDRLGLKGRSLREEWSEQAKELVAGLAPRAKIDQVKTDQSKSVRIN